MQHSASTMGSQCGHLIAFSSDLGLPGALASLNFFERLLALYGVPPYASWLHQFPGHRLSLMRFRNSS